MTLASERIKLSTTRSPVWTAVVVAVLSLGLAALVATAPVGSGPLAPEGAALGMVTLGVPVLMILAAMTVTGEYRSGMIRTTFMATPNRTWVLGAKTMVAAAFAGVFTAIMVIASVVLAGSLADPARGASLSLSDGATWRAVGAIALYAVLGAVLAVGVAGLLRHAGGVISLLLLWPLVIEPLVAALPRVGERIGPLLPFANAFTFISSSSGQSSEMWWGPFGALLYFSGFVAVVFLGAALVINRRDP